MIGTTVQPKVNINMKEVIAPVYKPLLLDVLKHNHSMYTLPGGRGSTKSSFVGGVAIPLLIMQYPDIHAVCFRKVGNTIQKSIFAQVVWGIYKLGLESYFHIPKNYSTPIVYKPTGQQIIFMGLDDPMKVKSIKIPFGYIGITWFEELDQFSGPEELRKVTQSTKRGGKMFWDFRSFNPPISKNNWANEFADEEEFKSDSSRSLVFRTNYTMINPDWLGEEFIYEAEDLKRKNPKAYEHEYMGIPIGTGGDVFPNVYELDMSKPHEVKDARGEVMYTTPLIDTFDNIHNGLDWGFAKDPTAFNRIHYDRNHHDVYIFKEARLQQKRNKEIFDYLYEEQKLLKKDELLTCDSAEPKSIADFKAFGSFVRGADKGPDSVRYSMRWFQGLNHIYIDRRACPETWKEFTEYEYEQDKDGKFISKYPDKANHNIDASRYALEDYWKRKGNA